MKGLGEFFVSMIMKGSVLMVFFIHGTRKKKKSCGCGRMYHKFQEVWHSKNYTLAVGVVGDVFAQLHWLPPELIRNHQVVRI